MVYESKVLPANLAVPFLFFFAINALKFRREGFVLPGTPPVSSLVCSSP